MSDVPEIQLELKERVNYPLVLQNSMMNQKAIIKEKDFNINKLHLMIVDDLFDIPSSWYDKQFAEDIKKVVTVRKVPNIQKHAGTILSQEYMIRNKIPLTIEKREIDYLKLKLAIRNLLDRLNMLIRKDKIEMTTGKNLSVESLDDLIDKLEAQEQENEET